MIAPEGWPPGQPHWTTGTSFRRFHWTTGTSFFRN